MFGPVNQSMCELFLVLTGVALGSNGSIGVLRPSHQCQAHCAGLKVANRMHFLILPQRQPWSIDAYEQDPPRTMSIAFSLTHERGHFRAPCMIPMPQIWRRIFGFMLLPRMCDNRMRRIDGSTCIESNTGGRTISVSRSRFRGSPY